MLHRREIGRKLFHLSASILPALYYAFGREKVMPLFVALLLFAIIVEAGRLRLPPFRRVVEKVFSGIMRGVEERRVSGATYILLGLTACALFFEPPIAFAVMLIVTVSDAVAALVGESFGTPRPRLRGKSWAGSTAFFLTAILIVKFAPGVELSAGLVGAAVATIVEVLPLPVNDNVAVPLAAGGVMELLS